MSSPETVLGPDTDRVLLMLIQPSACVASILRTYYTWQTVESPDTSWELIPMGYWTWAELSVGIIVGCLLTLPRFLGHIGPKFCRSTGNGPDRGSEGVTNAPKVKVPARVNRPFAKFGVGPSVFDSWNDHHTTHGQLQDGYLALDEIDTPLPLAMTISASVQHSGLGAAIARDDLECGKSTACSAYNPALDRCGTI